MYLIYIKLQFMFDLISRKISINNIFYLFILLLILVLIYYPILDNEFIYLWDDSWMITNKYTENGFSLDNIISILVHFYHGQYAPLNEFFIYSFIHYQMDIIHLFFIWQA